MESDKSAGRPAPRLRTPNRSQIELRPVDLESLLGPDHRARTVWTFVDGLDLSELYQTIEAVEGGPGRDATDPRVLLTLWLNATVDGVGSARALDRLTREHDAYRWICGGLSMNYHTLSDFRVGHVEFLDKLLTTSVATMMVEGLVDLHRVAQDGVRIRASAGASSFRRKPTLEECLRDAEEQVELLRRELDEDPSATTRRQKAARQRAAAERLERVQKALAQMPEAEAKKKTSEKDKARVSTTDPDARVMKMADGGFRPSFNGQLAVDTATQVVVGVDLTNRGSDLGEMTPMLDQLLRRHGRLPDEFLVDGGFASHTEIEKASSLGPVVYAPVSKPKDPTRERHDPMPGDSEAVANWRQRMGTETAKEIYKDRAATVECVNAHVRNRGLLRFLVRGKRKVRAVLLLHALAQNLMRAPALRLLAPQTA
ncbi:MAG: IS1182 family transposase [bacterium]|nr:IS1182 family transposase [bacterium]